MLPYGTGRARKAVAPETDSTIENQHKKIDLSQVQYKPENQVLICQSAKVLGCIYNCHYSSSFIYSVCKKCFCLCHRNSGFFHDLILAEVLELSGNVCLWFIIGSVIRCLVRVNVLSTFKFDAV